MTSRSCSLSAWTSRNVPSNDLCIQRILDPEIENRRSEEVSQAPNSGDGEGGGRSEAAHEGQQHNNNQIGESGCSEIEPELEAHQGYQCQRTDAEQQRRCRLPESDGLVRVQGNTGCREGPHRW